MSKAAGQKECETEFKTERIKRIYNKVMTYKDFNEAPPLLNRGASTIKFL